MADVLTLKVQTDVKYRCQSCGRNKDKLVWMEASYKDGVIGGYVCLKCVQSLEEDSTLSDLSVDWNDIKT
jgi:DNA-directed RNA polymerase subunit RPC12/RpoP